MHRPCCRKANAYDVASAIHSAFLRTTKQCLALPTVSAVRRTSSGSLAQRRDLRHEGSRPHGQPLNDHGRGRRSNAIFPATEEERAPTGDQSRRGTEDAANNSRMAYLEGLVGESGAKKSSQSLQRASSKAPERKAVVDINPGQRVQPRWTDFYGIEHVATHTWPLHIGRLAERMRGLAAGMSEAQLTAERGPMELDYRAFAVDPQQSKSENSLPLPWSVPVVERQNLSAIELLNEEITRFVSHITLTEDEQVARSVVVRQVHKRIYEIFPGKRTSAYVFGSHKTRTALPMSDLDIGLTDTSEPGHEQDMEKLYLRLFNHLQNRAEYICVVHRSGKYPIITAQHKDTGIDVQIVAGDGRTLQAQKMALCMEQMPSLTPLYALLRTIFGVRGFVDPYIGGISAYGTFMLLAASLNRRGTPVSVHASPATQLLHFLDFFANFNTERFGLSAIPPKPFLKHTSKSRVNNVPHTHLRHHANKRGDVSRGGQYKIGKQWEQQPYLLCLQDPAKSVNDLGRRVHAIKHIQLTIKYLSLELRDSMKAYDEGQFGDQADFSLLTSLIGRCHELFAERRQRVAEYGRTHTQRQEYLAVRTELKNQRREKHKQAVQEKQRRREWDEEEQQAWRLQQQQEALEAGKEAEEVVVQVEEDTRRPEAAK